MQTNPMITFAFYISVTISAFSALFWFGLGLREWLSAIGEVIQPYMQVNENGTPLWLIEAGYFLAILALGLFIGFVFFHFLLSKILNAFARPNGEYFDTKTSIQTCIRRDGDGEWFSACTKLTFALSFLTSFWLLQPDYSMLYQWGVTLSIGLYAAFQAFIIFYGIVNADITRTYYFKTKPGYDFYIKRLNDSWTDKTKDLFDKIDKQSTDYHVAVYLRDLSLGKKGPDKPCDYIGSGDPSIRYGPYTEEDRKKENEKYYAYEASQTRVG